MLIYAYGKLRAIRLTTALSATTKTAAFQQFNIVLKTVLKTANIF